MGRQVRRADSRSESIIVKFIATSLVGLYVIEPELQTDERGFFARTWCGEEFIKQGLNPKLAQCNVSFNNKAGTLRGLHYQIAPREEAKLVRCTMGAIFDVAVDIRPDSDTYLEWFGVELTAENRCAMYIPEGFAHGFQTLTDNSEVFYQMAEFYYPELAKGLRWDDPKIGIDWPKITHRIISDRDLAYSLL